jgi:hypothetical protein
MSGERTTMERLSKAARAAGFAMAAEEDAAQFERAALPVPPAAAVPGTELVLRSSQGETAKPASSWTRSLKVWLPSALNRGAPA